MKFRALLFGLFCVILAAGWSMPAWAMDQTSANNLATALLTQSGRWCGVVAVPHCGSGELAVAFWSQAGDSRLLVDGFESDPTLLASAQQKVDALGLLGRNLY